MSKKTKKEGKAEVQTQVVATEKTAPKKEKIDRRPYIPYVTSHLEIGDMDRKAMLKEILEQFPSVSKGGAQTFLTDMLNSKYSYYKERKIVKCEDGKVIFEDKLAVEPVPAEAVADERPVE